MCMKHQSVMKQSHICSILEPISRGQHHDNAYISWSSTCVYGMIREGLAYVKESLQTQARRLVRAEPMLNDSDVIHRALHVICREVVFLSCVNCSVVAAPKQL
jgi:hypothetical protein